MSSAWTAAVTTTLQPALTAVGTRAEGNDMNLGQPLVQDSGRQLVELPK
jgi:hypothetical protein